MDGAALTLVAGARAGGLISLEPIIIEIAVAAIFGTVWPAKDAYCDTCKMNGLKTINGGGRYEAQAAHIQSVEKLGPHTRQRRALKSLGNSYILAV